MTQRFFAPEVIQSSAMDCGPASLKCLLEGFGVHVSYGRLREACQTDVDGTSIDTLEEIGNQLGLSCEQIMVPLDHVLLRESDLFPCLPVVRLPSGFTHFVVAWRRHGPLVQVMDPATGRRWPGGARLLEELHVHTATVPAAAFREWASSPEFLAALHARLRELGCEGTCREEIDAALGDPDWRPLANLDAAVRMTQEIVRGGGLARGSEAARVIASLVRAAREGRSAIPESFFTAREAPRDPQASDGEQVLLRGAVLVRVRPGSSEPSGEAEAKATRPLSKELAAALAEAPLHAGQRLLTLLRADGLLTLPVLATALAMAVIGATFEAVLLRSLFELGRTLVPVQQRLAAIGALILFAAILLALEVPIAGGVLRLGRRLEVRLRMAFLEKLPRLSDRYFQSRPASDMAERSHTIHEVRSIPELGAQIARDVAELAVTVAAITWVDPASLPWALAAAAAAVAVPLAVQPAILERDMRARSHLGALSRFYLDALLGLVPLRTHGAERAVRREHEMLLVEWARAARSLLRLAVATDALQSLAAYAITLALVSGYLGRVSEPAGVLLLIYWALNLPLVGQELALTLRQYPPLRSKTLRLLEPLGAPEEDVVVTPAKQAGSSAAAGRGMALVFERTTVVAAGHTILDGIELRVAPGEHVAIVGASGAGKSSLLGALLGWHRPATGRIVVDGAPLDAARIEALRRATAWVDPAVHLWNRTLLSNLRYGATGPTDSLGPLLEVALLHDVLETMPDGLQTVLGEGGGLVSGGEGQRVRLGRALARRDARLVLLDEPFRGLDRERRHELLARARSYWHGATLLCVTHDIAETRAFDRVLVLEGGRLVEDAAPGVLAGRPDSRYAAMLAEEDQVRSGSWSSHVWRRLRLDGGRLTS